MRNVVVLGVLAALVAADVGRDLARAQKKGDIMAVQQLLRSMQKDQRGPQTAESLHKLMMQLDAKRAGAFVSAPCIARNLMLMATAGGDMKFVPDAAKVIRTHAKQRGAGKCAKAMTHYSDGMEALLAKDDAKAAAERA